MSLPPASLIDQQSHKIPVRKAKVSGVQVIVNVILAGIGIYKVCTQLGFKKWHASVIVAGTLFTLKVVTQNLVNEIRKKIARETLNARS